MGGAAAPTPVTPCLPAAPTPPPLSWGHLAARCHRRPLAWLCRDLDIGCQNPPGDAGVGRGCAGLGFNLISLGVNGQSEKA